ncbi:MAG TPA: decaprenyl-phosphate phosphoribosyltransferase, partial [Myxococcales bacterium]|nr:decaprenyl-phosphate phosphoribosyltransferase [Myxococcales bacterium]
MILLPLLEAMRPRQWSKNVFVFAGIVFAGRLFDHVAQLRVLACFGVFCAAASAVYLANDVVDRAADAQHPRKRLRPIASGRLPVAVALAASAVLAAGALLGASLLNRGTLALIAVYLLTTGGYILGLKRAFVLDVMIVASGFVLRAAVGAACIDAEISPWLLVCSFLLALFLALGKRRAEMVLLGDEATAHRESLGSYSLPLLDSWLTALEAAAIVSYALYTQSQRTVEHFGTTNLLYTVPFVIYALFRYQHHVVRQDAGGDPGSLLVQ